MKKKNIFFPVLGCLSGTAGVVSGVVLSCSVKDTVSALTKSAAVNSAGESFDFYSYFFGGSQVASVDDTALMAAKLVELCGKGFGLLLIFIGLFTVCYFGYKIEKELKAPDFPPPFMPCEPDFSCGEPGTPPAQSSADFADGNYQPDGRNFAADEVVYSPESDYSEEYLPKDGNSQ